MTVVANEKDVPPQLKEDLEFLDETYPEIDIEFVVQIGEFGPKLIKKLSKEWDIPANFMFIASARRPLPLRLGRTGRRPPHHLAS